MPANNLPADDHDSWRVLVALVVGIVAMLALSIVGDRKSPPPIEPLRGEVPTTTAPVPSVDRFGFATR